MNKMLIIKKIVLYLIIAALIFMTGAVSGVSFYMKNIHTPETILKTAVKKNELSDKNYILCKTAVTTGFEWLMIKDEEGKKTSIFCNIIGASPFDELNFISGFAWADNTFIFYIEEKKMVYSEATKQDEPEYVVTGWDMLYPVKREFIDLFSPKKYITTKDVNTEPR